MTEIIPNIVLESEANKQRLAHEYEYARDIRESAHQTAHVALRMIMILNGGAVIGLLTFVGNFGDVEAAGIHVGVAGMKAAIANYLCGLAAGALATILGYIGQDAAHSIAAAEANDMYCAMRDFEESARPRRTRAYAAVTVVLTAAIVCCIAGLIFFIVGSTQAVGAIGR